MIQLHYYPSTAAMIPHIVLEELGTPYELVLVDRETGAHKSPAYLTLNPNGLLPTLTDGDLVMYEAAAICLHLSDSHPEAGLAPPVGSVKRAHLYKWLMWLTNTLQPALITYFYPDRYVVAGNTAGAAQVKARAQARVGELLLQVDAELAQVQGQCAGAEFWFMGSDYTLLDAYLFTLCRWTRNFSAHPARGHPHLGPYLHRMLARPAVQRVYAQEGIIAPLI